MKGIRKGLACLLVGVLTLGATGFVSGSVYAENAPAVQATLTAQATYTGTAQGVSHTIEERENAIGSNVIVRVPVWIEKSGVEGYGTPKFYTHGGRLVDDALPVGKWSTVSFETTVSLFSDGRTGIAVDVTNCDGYTVKFGEATVTANGIPETLLGGATMYMLPSTVAEQNESFVILTENGKLIVMDGGNYGDGEFLAEFLLSFKSEVDAWFISHYHSDHIGAAAYILENDLITVNNLYYAFPSKEEHDKYDGTGRGKEYTKFVAGAENALNVERPVKGWTKTIDGLTFTALNSQSYYPVAGTETAYNYGNNTTIIYRMDAEDGESTLFLGDAGVQLGADVMANNAEMLKGCRIIQAAHHGQNGVAKAFYQFVGGDIYLVNAPTALWYANLNGTIGSNTTVTSLENREWFREVGAVRTIVAMESVKTIQ